MHTRKEIADNTSAAQLRNWYECNASLAGGAVLPTSAEPAADSTKEYASEAIATTAATMTTALIAAECRTGDTI